MDNERNGKKICSLELCTTKFICSGENVEAIFDRLPTAKILEELDGKYTIIARELKCG